MTQWPCSTGRAGLRLLEADLAVGVAVGRVEVGDDLGQQIRARTVAAATDIAELLRQLILAKARVTARRRGWRTTAHAHLVELDCQALPPAHPGRSTAHPR